LAASERKGKTILIVDDESVVDKILLMLIGEQKVMDVA
jgi:hypothetical protein